MRWYLAYGHKCHLWDKASGPAGLVMYGDAQDSQKVAWWTQKLSKMVVEGCWLNCKCPQMTLQDSGRDMPFTGNHA